MNEGRSIGESVRTWWCARWVDLQLSRWRCRLCWRDLTDHDVRFCSPTCFDAWARTRV